MKPRSVCIPSYIYGIGSGLILSSLITIFIIPQEWVTSPYTAIILSVTMLLGLIIGYLGFFNISLTKKK